MKVSSVIQNSQHIISLCQYNWILLHWYFLSYSSWMSVLDKNNHSLSSTECIWFQCDSCIISIKPLMKKYMNESQKIQASCHHTGLHLSSNFFKESFGNQRKALQHLRSTSQAWYIKKPQWKNLGSFMLLLDKTEFETL